MTSSRYRPTAALLTKAILIVGFLLVVAANMPGQLSNDSVRQLHEGHFQTRETWGPVVYAEILGVFDRIVPGAGLYTVSSIFLFFATLWTVASSKTKVGRFTPLAALVLVLSPTVLLYQGIVWKDVLFANLAILSFVLSGHIAKVWRSGEKPWLAILGLILGLAVASQVRQNGAIAAIFAVGALGWNLRRLGPRKAGTWSAGLLAAVALTSIGLQIACTPKTSVVIGIENRGVRSLLQYDILGVVTHEPRASLSIIAAVDPKAANDFLTFGAPLYSPDRVDFMRQDPKARNALKDVSSEVLERQWASLVLHHPGAYLRHRLDVFNAVFLTPRLDKCLPLFVGVDGPQAALVDLNLTPGVDPVDQRLYNYGARFLGTPLTSHLAFAALAVLVSGLLLRRRSEQDVAMIGLMASTFAFTASFFLISVACDYRYLYFLDLAALVGLFYMAADPPWTRFKLGLKS